MMPRPVGFVLGGGTSFGAVQVGMLQALAEVELRPDLVVGTSVGSVNGAVLAEDPSGAANRLSRLWSQITREDVFPGHAVERIRTWHQQHTYLVPSDGLEAALARVLSSERFEDLQLPFAATATELVSGRVDVKSEVGNDPYTGTAAGGVIGLLVGIIGGPLGVLLGGATGVLVSSLFDLDDVETTESALSDVSKQVHPTRTAVLAQVTKQSPEVIDTAMARLGGEVLRRPVVDVEQEIAAAQEAQRKAKREACKELQHARVEKHKKAAHAKVEALKSKLQRPKPGAPAPRRPQAATRPTQEP